MDATMLAAAIMPRPLPLPRALVQEEEQTGGGGGGGGSGGSGGDGDGAHFQLVRRALRRGCLGVLLRRGCESVSSFTAGTANSAQLRALEQSSTALSLPLSHRHVGAPTYSKAVALSFLAALCGSAGSEDGGGEAKKENSPRLPSPSPRVSAAAGAKDDSKVEAWSAARVARLAAVCEVFEAINSVYWAALLDKASLEALRRRRQQDSDRQRLQGMTPQQREQRRRYEMRAKAERDRGKGGAGAGEYRVVCGGLMWFGLVWSRLV